MATERKARAVFHDPALVKDAVRVLEEDGVAHCDIAVRRARQRGEIVERAPGPSRDVVLGALLGGGALTLWSLADPLAGALRTLFALIVGAATGAVFGALVGAARRWAARSYDDFLVEVRARDDADADHLREILAGRGGEPVAP